jgi:hypothetical protein
MTMRRSTLLRWTEEAEAEQMRAMAMSEREPQNIAACPVAAAQHFFSKGHAPALLGRLRGWFGAGNLPMVRDKRR